MASKKKAVKDVTPAAPEVAPQAPPKSSAKKPAPAKLPAVVAVAVAAPRAAAKGSKPVEAAVPKSPAARSPSPKRAEPTLPASKSGAAKIPLAKGGSERKPPTPAKAGEQGAAKPSSQVSSANAPGAKAPVSEAPVSKAPVSKAPASKAPVSKTPASKAPASKAPASKAPLAKTAPAKAPIKAPSRASGGGLDDFDDPDDDDLDGEEEKGVSVAALPPVEEDEEPAVALVTPEVAQAARAAKRLTPRVVPPMPPRKPGVVTVALSPDADDAFMLYALAHGKIETEGRRYEFVRGDIAALNDESVKGTYDVTAFSFGAWPQVVERYLALPCGASFGDGVGPVVVSKTPVRPSEVDGMLVGVPGLTTTAALVLRLWLAPARLKLVSVPFQEVVGAVKSGKVRAGVLIHEAQLTYRLDGLTKVMDLGRWWTDKTEGLPLPLGGTAIRRDIPAEERTKIALDLKRSIAYAMGHREEALEHAAKFSKGLPRQLLDRYVTMYVNELTLDIGERGRQAVHTLFDYAVRMGSMKERIDLELA